MVSPFWELYPLEDGSHLWRVLHRDKDGFGMRYLGKFALLLLVVEEKREEQVLSAKSSDNNESGAFFVGIREHLGRNGVQAALTCVRMRGPCVWTGQVPGKSLLGLVSVSSLWKRKGDQAQPLCLSVSLTHIVARGQHTSSGQGVPRSLYHLHLGWSDYLQTP